MWDSIQELTIVTRAFAAEHAVWGIAICLVLAIGAIASLNSTNVERDRHIRGGHYKGKVTPKWMKAFAREQSLREEQAAKARAERERQRK